MKYNHKKIVAIACRGNKDFELFITAQKIGLGIEFEFNDTKYISNDLLETKYGSFVIPFPVL